MRVRCKSMETATYRQLARLVSLSSPFLEWAFLLALKVDMTYLEKRQAIPVNAPNFYQLLESAWTEYAVFAKTKIIELDLARANQHFILADSIRADLENEGVTVMTGKTNTDYFI